MFELIFLTLFVLAWTILGTIPWLTLSIATRGRVGLRYLLFAIFAANVGGIAVPVLGLTSGTGIVVSMLVAFATASTLLFARRISLVDSPATRTTVVHGHAGRDE